MSEDRIVKLGGRPFRAVAVSTVQRDVFVMGRVRTAGLDSLPMDPTAETPEQYALRVLEALLVSPGVLELVGALIIPSELEDEFWTPDVAAETAIFVGRLKAEADKAEVKQLLLGILIPFLESGLGNWTALQRSSASVTAPLDPGSRSLEAASSTGSGPA